MKKYNKGDLVELDGLLAVVVGTDNDDFVPEGHLAVWFGEPRTKRISEGGKCGSSPEIWTIPEDLFIPAAPPEIKH